MPRILHLAELVAQLLADGQTAALKELLDFGRDYRNASAGELESLLHEIEEKVRQLASVLSLQLPDGLECVDLLAEAHRQMSAVASQAAEDLIRAGRSAEAAEGPAGGDDKRRQDDLLVEELRTLADAVRTAAAGHPRPTAAPAPLHPAQSAASQADPGLLGWLTAAGRACRQSRQSLSLLLVELDHLDELLLLLGPKDFEELRRLLEATCRSLDHPWTTCLAHGEAGFALILPNCQRRLAVELGDQLLRSMYALKSAQHAGGPQAVTLSVGVATVPLPPKNFSPEDLLSAADHCLYGSRAGGGGVVKSIEI